MSFNPGDTFGDYQVLGPIGSGGMGRVFRVRNTISGRIEAMKVLRSDSSPDLQLSERFSREIQLLAGLNHPNIASLYTALRIQDQIVMIMEYVDGITLAQKLRDRPIRLAEGLDIVSQVLLALDCAHSRGVIHRDIKPDNILLGPGGIVKLTDFGIARAAADPRYTRAGTLVGTLHYMSPEQIQGQTESLDGRSDLYSLGILLYEISTGRRPFEGDSDLAIMMAHLEQPPRPPITLAPELPAGLNEVILKALAKEPRRRYQTAHDMATAVAVCMANLTRPKSAAPPLFEPSPPQAAAPPPASPPPAIPTPPAPPKQHRFPTRPVLGIAAAVLLVLTGVTLGLRLRPHPAPPPPPAQTASNLHALIPVSYAGLVETTAGGAVTWRRGDDDDTSHWQPLPINTILSPGDSVCAHRAHAEIVVDQQNYLRIGAGACLTVLQDGGRLFQFKLTSGTVTLAANVNGMSYEADTPSLTFTSDHSGAYRIGIANDGSASLRIQTGAGVATTPDGAFETLDAPAAFNAPLNGQAQRLPMDPPDDWDLWNEQRDKTIAALSSAKYLPPGLGAGSLGNYGRWTTTPSYGNVWLPNAGPDWVPYRLGRWTWVAPYGWTWTSFEPWGFTPYHFGRWANLPNLGWTWIPGPATTPQHFEPALVAFASGNFGGDWVAWLPLAPGEPYRRTFSLSTALPPISHFANAAAVTVVNRSEISQPTSSLYLVRALDPSALQRSESATFSPIRPTESALYPPPVLASSLTGSLPPETAKPSVPPPPPTINRPVVAHRNLIPAVPTIKTKLAGISAPGAPLNPQDAAQPVPISTPLPPPHPLAPAIDLPSPPKLDSRGQPISPQPSPRKPFPTNSPTLDQYGQPKISNSRPQY